jgi:hypothetical protein
MGRSIVNQMTLGKMIDVLRRKDPKASVYLDFVHFRPKGIHSYRGYYDQIAIGYATDVDPTVKDVLEMLEGAVGQTFTGYKGGEYGMDWDTPVWIANHNESGSTAVTDIQDAGWRVRIVTVQIDD